MREKSSIRRIRRVCLVVLSMFTLLTCIGCGKAAEQAKKGKTLEDIWGVQLEEITDIHIETEEDDILSLCDSEKSELQKFAKKIINIVPGKKIDKLAEDADDYAFCAILSVYNDNFEMMRSMELLQYETAFAVVIDESKTIYYEKNTDTKETCETVAEMVSDYNSQNAGNNLDMQAAKPIIYLYPEQKQNIQVKVDGVDFTTVYPAYNKGWSVEADADGTLYLLKKDKSGEEVLDLSRSYYSLYYEGKITLPRNWEESFVVEKKDYESFLEEKLRILGLSDREAEEFIVYWLPQLQRYEKVQIRFTEQQILDKQIPLTITPKPDTTIRVFMEWREAKGDVDVKEQMLKKIERKGYTAVEWGGEFVE